MYLGLGLGISLLHLPFLYAKCMDRLLEQGPRFLPLILISSWMIPNGLHSFTSHRFCVRLGPLGSVFEFVINVILILILIFHLSFYFNEIFFHFRMIRPNEHIVVKTCTLNGLLLQNKSIDPKVCPCICVYACVCV